MSASLTDKIRKLEDEHADEFVSTNLAAHEKRQERQALFMLGGIRAVNRVTENLSSQIMQALINFQREEGYRALGFDNFVAFLEKSEFAPMSKHEFYKRKEIFESEGGELYDAFNANKIPLSTRKLLAASGVNISVDGDDLVIADQRVPITDRSAMKELVDTVHEVLRERDAREEKKDKKIGDLETVVAKGTAEFEELQRAFDARDKMDPHDAAVSRVILDMLQLTEEIGSISDERKAEKGKVAIDTLWNVMLKVRESYGVNYAFTEGGPRSQVPAVPEEPMSLVDRVLAEDDDFGDEEEG